MKHIYQFTEEERTTLDNISSDLYRIYYHYNGLGDTNYLAEMLWPIMDMIDKVLMLNGRALPTTED